MIRAEHQNAANITTSRVSLNTVKAIGREMDKFNGGYKTLACYDCLRAQEFTEQLQEKIMEYPSKKGSIWCGKWVLLFFTMKLTLNEDLHYSRCKVNVLQIRPEKTF